MFSQLLTIKRYSAALMGIWTLLIAASLVWLYLQQKSNYYEIARAEARIAFQKDTLYRKWAAKHGGVYAPATEETKPNPYLTHISERDLTTPSGRLLTLINPAYMTRQVFELADKEEAFVKGHITSLKPIRPENAPDPWERNALAAFESGVKEVSDVQLVNGQEYMRLMRPFITEQPCLKCHAAQGYNAGDIRGGISVSVPMAIIDAKSGKLMGNAAIAHFVLWGIGLGFISFFSRRLSQSSVTVHEQTVHLEQEVAERMAAQEMLQEQAALLEEEIVERQQAEETALANQNRLQLIMDSTHAGIYGVNTAGECIFANKACLNLIGYDDVAEVLGKNMHNLIHHTLPGGVPAPVSACKIYRAYHEGVGVTVSDELFWRRDGTSFPVEYSSYPIVDNGVIEGAVISFVDLTERVQAREALEQSEATVRTKLKAILEPEGDLDALELSDIIDCETLRALMDNFYHLTGILGAVLDISGKVLVAVGWQEICTRFHRCHPESLQNCLESDTILTTDVPFGTFRQYRCKNNLWDMVTPLVVGGKHVGNVFIGQFFYDDEELDLDQFREQARRYGFDETDYLAALARVPRFSREKVRTGIEFYATLTKMISELSFSSIKISRALTERLHLEEQLRQSQKMEAIGQLAGGVAHDFNNILQVISGYGALLKMGGSLNEKQNEEIDQILSASERAAQLTRGLLAFSRKQDMKLAVIDLNDIVENVKKFLVRIIGEDVQLKTAVSPQKLKIHADMGQIEQVMINLATNARDAMQKGGLLAIETGLQAVESPLDQESGRTRPGNYAVLSVSDTGIGMNIETCRRIFEPFYTTKEAGKGTGLGMAIVYGVVKQHNGFINVYSEPGHGTTFRVYIPIHESEKNEDAGKVVKVSRPQGGNETILVAEDDDTVRKLVVNVLTQFGYTVIQATDGEEAVRKFSEHKDKVAMALMDMIMPKMNGKEVYDEINKLKPGIKVLFASGYTAEFLNSRGVSEEGIELITKPIQPMELLRKLREIIDKPAIR